MFSYYGSKSKIIHLYPPPKYDKIIESFAGSARYSLKYWDRDITIIDKYKTIVQLWQWLQKCNKNDVLKLPKLKKGDDIRLLNLTQEEKWLLGFSCQAGVSAPANMTSSLGEQNSKTFLKNIADNLHKIKQWKIKHESYNEHDNIEATWFIDPPYQFGGHSYKESNKNIDFKELAEWCKSRNGQTIVCENTKADWLPFKPIINFIGTVKLKTTEAIWSNHITNYEYQQQSLF